MGGALGVAETLPAAAPHQGVTSVPASVTVLTRVTRDMMTHVTLAWRQAGDVTEVVHLEPGAAAPATQVHRVDIDPDSSIRYGEHRYKRGPTSRPRGLV